MPKTNPNPPDLKTQHGRLRWAREQKGYKSPRDAAEWLPLGNVNTYKSHENGVRRKEGLSVKHLEMYAKALGVSSAWLATGSGDPFRPDLPTDDLRIAERLLNAARE